ncbi:hypothetical protein ACFO4O_16620 [Glaciecola siphonariae]|uniref:Uncharacterized protein n=1 Tax=Glaciecola siphonariae TaxID=521012 RepID=A0ABV9LZ11_9ALTE
MKKIMIPFHATLEELVEYIHSVSSELGLFITVMSLRPFELKEIEGKLSLDELSVDRDIRVLFSAKRPSLDASSSNRFYDSNQGVIGLHIGRMTKQGLKESVLAFMSDDNKHVAMANKVASILKKATKAGAIAVNPVNGAEANARSHRYTIGAKMLYEEGIRLLPLAGHSYFKLSE